MKEVFLLSGLGADQRVFEYLDLQDYKLNFIKWLPPKQGESIEDYAQRLSVQIHSPLPTLIGVSFGGMMAIEIGKLIATDKIVLISSAKTKSEIPLYFRMIGRLRIHKLVPVIFLKSTNQLTYWIFGIRSKEEKRLLKSIMAATDPFFLTWAIDKIVNWNNTTRLKNVVHIHGSADRLLPPMNADIQIENGGHLMIISECKQLSKHLNKVL